MISNQTNSKVNKTCTQDSLSPLIISKIFNNHDKEGKNYKNMKIKINHIEEDFSDNTLPLIDQHFKGII